jgi:Zn-dependent protease with chaperone function
MDFFAAQAAARRRTAVLVAWFALALLGTIAVVWAGLGALALGSPDLAALAFGPELGAAVAGGVVLVTGTGAAVHHARLARGGGHAVATMLGGVAVDRRSEDPGERRLVNVVEEMAIAAGLAVPALYVLPAEAGINAFAAGFTPDRSVVAVTRGALDELTRDELQGVVAHELSHVLNGDARLNLRLLALIGGLTVLASIGRVLARTAGESRSRWRSRRSSGGGMILAAGLCIWLAGAVGAFFGRVIRAAVSRQRELLADAAAVQFTRNPEGLAGALAKIARTGSRVGSAFAPEAAHLFFANGLATRWLATHPPIEERIRRLVPHRAAGIVSGVRAAEAAAAADVPLTASALVASVGRPAPGHLADAARAISGLPAAVADAARDPGRAPVLVRALLADPESPARLAQLARLADAAVRGETKRLAAALLPVPRGDRMALLDLALPALDALPADAATALVRDLGELARADGRTTLFEWAVLRVVSRRLARTLGTERRARVGARALEDVQVDVLDLLSALAWAGARDEAGAQATLDAALAVVGVRGWRVLPRDRIAGSRLEAALARLEGAAPPLKARVLEACAASVLHDGVVRAAEGELVRAVAASLGIPVPPLVATTPAARAALAAPGSGSA